MQVITGKERTPGSVIYDGWIPLRFPAVALDSSGGVATVSARIPLALNVKILAVSAVVSGATSGTPTFNIVQGVGAYETPGSAGAHATGNVTVDGISPNAGTTGTITINGHASSYTTLANGESNDTIGNGLTAAINANPAVNTQFTATYATAIITITANAVGTAGNVSLASTGGPGLVLVASGPALTGGANASSGTAPVLPVTDTTPVGIVPTTTAQPTQALFAADIAMVDTAELVQNFYPTVFDAVWPAGSQLTLRTATGATGNLDVIVWAKPVDVNFTAPASHAQYFIPGPTTL